MVCIVITISGLWGQRQILSQITTQTYIERDSNHERKGKEFKARSERWNINDRISRRSKRTEREERQQLNRLD